MRTIFYIALIIIAVLSVWLSFSISQHEIAKQENTRLSENLKQYGERFSSLTLTTDELRNEIDKKDSRLLKADSILKTKNKYIKQLETLVYTKVDINNTDTVLVRDTLIKYIKELNKYKVSFNESKSCISISGYIMTSDSLPQMFITQRKATVEVFDIKTKRKWWQFWKPKTERIVSSDCGEVEILEINKK